MILGVVLINAIVGFVQEGKAESAMAAPFAKMLSPHAMVLRDEQRREIGRGIGASDWVRCNRAIRCPPTLRLVEARNLADSGSGADR